MTGLGSGLAPAQSLLGPLLPPCLPGYVMFNSERVNRISGGVLLYVKDSLQPSFKDTHKIDNVDSVTVQLKTCSRKLLMNLIYRPPSCDAASDINLFDQITEVSNVSECIFLAISICLS